MPHVTLHGCLYRSRSLAAVQHVLTEWLDCQLKLELELKQREPEKVDKVHLLSRRVG